MFKKQFIILISKANWLIQSKRKVKNCYITYNGRYDGAGAQIHSVLSIILFAKKFNLQYLHTPLTEVEHFKGDRIDWSNTWELFFSLGYNESTLHGSLLKTCKLKFLKYPGLINKRANTIYKVSNCHSFTDLIANDYNLLLKDFKSKYYLNAKECFLKNTDLLNIAVHVRRGDVKARSKKFNRYTANEKLNQYLSLITGLLKNKKLNYTITIFSQGAESDFYDLFCYNPTFILNDDEFKTFHSLVKADILLMAKSSFSYVAALLNEGIIFYDPFWHKPLKKWIDITKKRMKIEEIFSKEINIR